MNFFSLFDFSFYRQLSLLLRSKKIDYIITKTSTKVIIVPSYLTVLMPLPYDFSECQLIQVMIILIRVIC
jgi:hypothetical protein